jgi:copper resistance protein C
LEVSVPALAPGRYRVVWRVLSLDTHVTEGDFTFDVAP